MKFARVIIDSQKNRFVECDGDNGLVPLVPDTIQFISEHVRYHDTPAPIQRVKKDGHTYLYQNEDEFKRMLITAALG